MTPERWLVLADGRTTEHPTHEAAFAHAQALVDERGQRITGGAWSPRDQGEIVVCEVRHRVALVERGPGAWEFRDVAGQGEG